MQPSETFTADDIVTIKNIDGEAFEFTLYGETYLIPAGESAPMPGYMAAHAIKHMIDEMMQKDGKTRLTNQPNERKLYYERIFVGVEKTLKPKIITDSERARAEFDKARGATTEAKGLNVATEGIEDEVADSLVNELEANNTPAPFAE